MRQPMHDPDDVLELERAGWEALSTGGRAPADFYGEVLDDDDLVFVFPGGLVLDDRAAIIESMSGPPWDEYTLSDERIVRLGADAAMVVYRAEARRGDLRYEARCTSTYTRSDGRWRLRVHQQTP